MCGSGEDRRRHKIKGLAGGRGYIAVSGGFMACLRAMISAWRKNLTYIKKYPVSIK
jgi:hypothetical protein